MDGKSRTRCAGRGGASASSLEEPLRAAPIWTGAYARTERADFSVRIIAGKFRGRKLECPEFVTRPTLDRVREALFSILGDISDQVVVDLYAGSGALGLEALSRGARQVTLVEADRAAVQVIRKNVANWGADAQLRILQSNVERAGAALSAAGPLDLVLADPPWKIAIEAALTVQRLVKDMLAPGALLVLGHAARDELGLLEDGSFALESRRTWGDSGLSFLRHSS